MNLINYRKTLGITAKQAQMFDLLLKNSPQNAKQLASRIGCLPNAVYRLGKKLESMHYIVVSKQQPRLYSAVALPVALEIYKQRSTQQHQAMIQDLLTKKDDDIGKATTVQIITGRQELYKTYIEEANKAQIEILVFAIGIAYSKELENAQKLAIKRSVEVRHIVQKKEASNYHVIEKWLRLGVKMRYYPIPTGFHLMIFDANTVILSLSNPTNTEQRTSLVFESPTAAQTLRDYFYGIWGASKLIS